MSVGDIVQAAQSKLSKTGCLMVVSALVAGGLLVGKAYGGGPGACDDGVPDAFFTVHPTNKAVGELNAILNGNVSVACNDPIVSYEWSFGDGSTTSGANVSHTYSVGTYYPTLTITDAAGLTDSYTPQAGLIVKADNQNPMLTNATTRVLQGESITVDMSGNGSDPDGDDISTSYYLPDDAQHGTSHNTEKGYVHRYSSTGQFVYTAGSNAVGQDMFQVGIRDGFGGTATATVTVTIPQRVTAVADTVTTQESTDVVIDVTANDTSYQNEPFEIYWTSIGQTGGRVVNVDKAAGTITFRPDPGFVGTGGFDYGIKSLVPNTWWTSQAHVEVNVLPAANHAPIATNDSLTVNEDTVGIKNVLSNDSDPDNDPLTVAIVSGPQHGTATLGADGTLNYTPVANYSGSDSLTYQITDDDGVTDTATVSITTTAVNDVPQASFSWTKLADGTISFNASGSSDIDSNIVSYRWNFGDGASSTTSTSATTHKYKGKISRTVVLTVIDAGGAQATYTATVTP